MTPAELWRAAPPVTADPEVSSWLEARGLDPAKVAALGLARALPRKLEASPPWARTWAGRRARVLVPLRSPSGELGSLSALVLRPTPEAVRRARLERQARAASLVGAGMRPSMARLVAGDDGPNGPDVLAPKGLERAGSVAANALGTRWLAGARSRGARCVVVRGELAWIARSCAEGRGVAVFGLVPGASWARTVAKCLPDGSTLALQLGDDATGDRLAAAFVGTLATRLRAGAVALATTEAA